MATTSHTGRGGPAVGGSATTTFTHGTGQVGSDIVVEWDLDNDGDFDETVEDITSYVMAAETLTGRDFPSHLTGQAGPGMLKLTLLNTDDRFSYFNTSSPLAAAPYSLRTGRKVRVRTTDAVASVPMLLARDRFDRPDGPLGVAETGQTWALQTAAALVVEAGTAVTTVDGSYLIATVDVGDTDHYVQASIPRLAGGAQAGLIARWTDSSNYSYMVMTGGGLILADVNGGVDSQIGTTLDIDAWPGMTIGIGVSGTTITGYLSGVPVISGTLTGPINGTDAGLIARGSQGRVPALDDFHAWTGITPEVDGVIWTGHITEVRPVVPIDGVKAVEVTAEGPLADGASQDIDPPRILAGTSTGYLAGDILARAGLLHPPSDAMDAGTVTTGPVALYAGPALELARMAEETERGFLHETNEGAIGYQDATGRATVAPSAAFSDQPGGQFGYSAVDLLDSSREVVNRVTAGVAAKAPSGITQSEDSNNTTVGVVANHVDVTLPTTAAGDLLVIFIASTVYNSAVDWLVPIWWVEHRNTRADIAMRVYSHWCDGTESGSTVRFYTDSATAGGAWKAHIYRFESWYDSYTNGIAMGEPVQGSDPAGLDHGWGRYPTTFIAVNAGMASVNGGNFTDDPIDPDGYSNGISSVIFASANGADVGLASAYKTDIVDAEDPSAFSVLTGFMVEESVVFAVRGYNGPHTLATLANPRTTGGTGVLVTVDDVGSQHDHRAVLPHVVPSNLFASEADATAYGEAVLAAQADDRPIITLSFFATTNAAYRAQAIRRRVGHKVHVEADGATGLGIDGDFFIENIGHRWSYAGKVWEVTWQLSPA